MKCLLLTYYASWRGGTNNVQVARLYAVGCSSGFVRQFTSLRERAADYARAWARKHGIALV